MDRVDATKRSAIMRSVRSKDTKPEMALRSALHARGLRFRLHAKLLAGRPDIVLPRWRACIFVHGCFWHRHGCSMTTTPKSNEGFWNAKFETNRERDRRAVETLSGAGWRVLTVWQCGLTGKGSVETCAAFVMEWLARAEPVSEFPSATSRIEPP
jgi:DNA mismatch endonuclease (patch repair protein)